MSKLWAVYFEYLYFDAKHILVQSNSVIMRAHCINSSYMSEKHSIQRWIFHRKFIWEWLWCFSGTRRTCISKTNVADTIPNHKVIEVIWYISVWNGYNKPLQQPCMPCHVVYRLYKTIQLTWNSGLWLQWLSATLWCLRWASNGDTSLTLSHWFDSHDWMKMNVMELS